MSGYIIICDVYISEMIVKYLVTEVISKEFFAGSHVRKEPTCNDSTRPGVFIKDA